MAGKEMPGGKEGAETRAVRDHLTDDRTERKGLRMEERCLEAEVASQWGSVFGKD
jgi:hypothetical protein